MHLLILTFGYIIVAKLNLLFNLATISFLTPQLAIATTTSGLLSNLSKISKYIEIGQGTIIYPGVILTVNTNIGNHVIISGNCGIGHDTVIGDYSSVLWGSNFSGFDIVGEECFIGIGTKIIQGINIGSIRKIGAGTVVIENIK